MIKPMLSTLVESPFNRKNWLFEIKWDGYRAIAEVSRSEIQLYSRNFHSFAELFPSVLKALKKIKEEVILDGEIVLIDKEGHSDFQLLQNYLNSGESKGALRFMIFDILSYRGKDLRNKPLIERKKILHQFMETLSDPVLQYSDYIEEKGLDFFKEAKKEGLEGIMAKDMESHYISRRSRSWLKIKTHSRQEVVIGGFTEPKGSRKWMGALLVGVYKGEDLIYSGRVGGGFDFKDLEHVYNILHKLKIDSCPFLKRPQGSANVTWVEPKIVCEVSFQEWTGDGRMRQPVFEGLRIDKDPKSVKKEEPKTK